MMDLETIKYLNKKAGKQAREDNVEPKVLSYDEIVELEKSITLKKNVYY